MPQRPVHRPAPAPTQPHSSIRVVKSLPLQAAAACTAVFQSVPLPNVATVPSATPPPASQSSASLQPHHWDCNIMHRLNRNRVRARAQLAVTSHAQTSSTASAATPETAAPSALHPIHPCATVSCPSHTARTPHRLIQRHRLPVNHTLLRRLLLPNSFASAFVIQAALHAAQHLLPQSRSQSMRSSIHPASATPSPTNWPTHRYPPRRRPNLHPPEIPRTRFHRRPA